MAASAPRAGPDGCEIGYTWLAPQAIRTAANTEAKLLMLRHAFDTWDVQRVCFHTDVRNERSRNALLGIGARFEGVLRAHRLSADAEAARLGALLDPRHRVARRARVPAASPGRRRLKRLRAHSHGQ